MTPATIEVSKQVELGKIKVWFAHKDLGAEGGTRDDIALIWSRLIIGRELAREYFTGDAAEYIDDALIVIKGLSNKLHQSKLPQTRASAGQMEILRTGLQAMDEMIALTTAKERSDIRSTAAKAMERELAYA